MNNIPEATSLYNNVSTFVSPFYTYSSVGNLISYGPIQSTETGKYFNHIIYKEKMPTPAGNKHLSVYFFFRRPRFFHLSTEKVRV